jgi:GTP-binding protein Era
MENIMEDMASAKSGYVAIIGRPNVGKSTMMNKIIGQKIAITSAKPQTTRNRIQTVFTDERGQIVFMDTPGIHEAQSKLGTFMDAAAESTISEADCILWLVEPSTFIGAGERHIAEKLKSSSLPIILVINKTDKVKKDQILKFIDSYKEILSFSDIIPISALTGDGVTDVISTIFKYLPYGPMFYDEETVTQESMREIAAEIIREKALRLLKDEVPHGIAVEVTKMHERKRAEKKKQHVHEKQLKKEAAMQAAQSGEEENGGNDIVTDTEATIYCERDSHKGIIIGKDGEMLKKIGTAARIDIEGMTGTSVNLRLWVKVQKNWKDDEKALKKFGYVEHNDQ